MIFTRFILISCRLSVGILEYWSDVPSLSDVVSLYIQKSVRNGR